MHLKFSNFILLSAVLSLTTSCARQISPNVYSADSVGEASRTYSGVIISLRTVEVQDKERLEENGLGLMGGAMAGGLTGSLIGGGRGNVAATGVGAVLGSVGGMLLEKEIKKQSGIEYIVRLADGSAMTVVQGVENPLPVGQRVLVIVSHKGRSRIVPDTGMGDPIKNPTSTINLNLNA
jgi:outer membrane lipoprotein SlyB